MSSHISASTPTTPSAAPATRSPWRSPRRAPAEAPRAARSPTASPTRLPDVASSDDERERREQSGARRRAARARRRRRRRARPRPRCPTASPAHDEAAADEPEPVAEPARAATDRERRREVEEVHGRGASSRAWVRKPVCATMRWSGRTDWPSTCQVRCSTSSDSAIPNAEPASSSRRRATWPMVGQVREQDAARVQRRLGVLHHPPRLGQVEQDAVEVVARSMPS